MNPEKAKQVLDQADRDRVVIGLEDVAGVQPRLDIGQLLV